MIKLPLLVALALAASLLLGSSCEPPPPPPPGEGEGEPIECFFGDEAAPPAGELVYRTVDGETALLVEGQEVPLILPPQGGKVFIVGARVKNMDLCSLQVNAGMFDECQTPPRIIGREGRGLQMLVDDELGLGVPAQPDTLNNYANIPVCPNFTAVRDADGEPFRIEVRVTDRARRSLILEAHVTPVCAEADAFERCSCECSPTPASW